jgi:hypothetical protein
MASQPPLELPDNFATDSDWLARKDTTLEMIGELYHRIAKAESVNRKLQCQNTEIHHDLSKERDEHQMSVHQIQELKAEIMILKTSNAKSTSEQSQEARKGSEEIVSLRKLHKEQSNELEASSHSAFKLQIENEALKRRLVVEDGAHQTGPELEQLRSKIEELKVERDSISARNHELSQRIHDLENSAVSVVTDTNKRRRLALAPPARPTDDDQIDEGTKGNAGGQRELLQAHNRLLDTLDSIMQDLVSRVRFQNLDPDYLMRRTRRPRFDGLKRLDQETMEEIAVLLQICNTSTIGEALRLRAEVNMAIIRFFNDHEQKLCSLGIERPKCGIGMDQRPTTGGKTILIAKPRSPSRLAKRINEILHG